MDIDKKLDGAKDLAGKAIDAVKSNKDVKDAADKAIGEVEKKVKVDLPDVDGIAKTLGK
ncbi:MAG: hypothetical protein IKN14_06970 [Clostridiales bacterium]|nr:hypothetical protein [Clostridiales bacterium]